MSTLGIHMLTLYAQAAEILAEEKGGYTLHTAGEYARMLGVSKATARKWLEGGVREGYFERRDAIIRNQNWIFYGRAK